MPRVKRTTFFQCCSGRCCDCTRVYSSISDIMIQHEIHTTYILADQATQAVAYEYNRPFVLYSVSWSGKS